MKPFFRALEATAPVAPDRTPVPTAVPGGPRPARSVLSWRDRDRRGPPDCPSSDPKDRHRTRSPRGVNRTSVRNAPASTGPGMGCVLCWRTGLGACEDRQSPPLRTLDVRQIRREVLGKRKAPVMKSNVILAADEHGGQPGGEQDGRGAVPCSAARAARPPRCHRRPPPVEKILAGLGGRRVPKRSPTTACSPAAAGGTIGSSPSPLP
jgi:hypothetical protein